MARGDYVKTYAGAVAQGALNVIRGVFGAGGSISRAADLLQERFQSLPRQVATAISSNTFRQAAARALARQTQEVLHPRPPAAEITPQIPSTYRYLVEAVAVHEDEERVAFSSHYFDSQDQLDPAELADMMRAWLGQFYAIGTGKCPESIEEFEDVTDIEYNVVRIQARG